jgi:hypothetical protein
VTAAVPPRKKNTSRLPAEQTFKNPKEAAKHIRDLTRGGRRVYGTKSAMESVGIQPHHYLPEGPKRLPDAEAELLAGQTDRVAGDVKITYRPTPSSNPGNPRTAGAGYDPVSQRLAVTWGDGRTPYYYYDVPPQVWDGFLKADSPGKYINSVLNNFAYGPVDSDDT